MWKKGRVCLLLTASLIEVHIPNLHTLAKAAESPEFVILILEIF